MVEERFPTSGLSAEYGDIIMNSVTKTVSLEVSYQGKIILSEIYVPDSDAKIYIKDLGMLAMNFKSKADFSIYNGIDGACVQLTVSLTEGSQVVSKDVTIYQCIVDFADSLNIDLLKTIPLSRMTKKKTGVGRTEFTSFYGGSTVKAYIVKKGHNQDIAITVNIIALANPNNMYRINVSPEIVAALADCYPSDLVYYEIYTNKDQVIRFVMEQRSYPQLRTFVFRNCFGAQESFTCTGDEESSRKWSREYGLSKNINIQLTRDLVNSITVNTGLVTNRSVEALEDLLNSDQLALLDAQGFQAIIILEENFKNNSRRDEVRSFDFTYRFAGYNQFRTTYAPFKTPRVFDDTFNETFN